MTKKKAPAVAAPKSDGEDLVRIVARFEAEHPEEAARLPRGPFSDVAAHIARIIG